MNDRSISNVEAYAERHKNKSIWRRGGALLALLVVFLTAHALIFPAHTAERAPICGQKEHVHDESCWLAVLSCALEEDEGHTHDADCYRSVLICGLEEHVHGEACYAAPADLRGTGTVSDGETTEPPTEGLNPVTEPAEDDLQPELPSDEEPEPVTEPEEPAEPTETEAPTEPTETEAPTEPEEPDEPLPVDPAPLTPPEPAPEGQTLHDAHSVAIWGLTPDGQLDFPENGIDLAPYLTSAVFMRQTDAGLVPATEFVNGETAYGAIGYDILRNVVTSENRYVYYQLPDGIRPLEETSGDVMSDGAKVGDYTITEDGVIHILFDESFANGNAITGAVEFACSLYANDDGTDRVIEFENGVGTITVRVPDEQKYDLSLEKYGDFNTDYTEAIFTVVISTEKGTGYPIDLSDVLTNQTPATLLTAIYSAESFTVEHVAADGTHTPVEVTPVISEDGMSFELLGLPALEAGEQYELTYHVELDANLGGDFELDNQAEAQAGVLESDSAYFISYVCDITKSGTFNAETGLIDWVIVINPDNRPVADWRIEDTLPYPAVGQVLLTNANGARFADLTPADGVTISYTFPNNAPRRTYYLRYSTVAPTTAETVQNSVRLINDRDITVTAEVVVRERPEGVAKSVNARYAQPDGMVHTYWSFSVIPPLGDLEEYTFRDVISQSVQDVNTGEALDNTLHFGYAAELEAAFQGNLRLISNGKSYRYADPANHYVNFEITYYDAGGNVVEADDETTHVSHVVFRLTPKQGSTFRGYEIAVDNYPTWLDASSAQVDDYWSYENRINLPGGLYDQATAFYRKANAFIKQLKVDGRFTDDGTMLDYDECGGLLEYRLLLDLGSMEGEDFTVTDLLPPGMALVEGSARAFFTGSNLYNEYAGTFAEGGTFTVQTQANADGSTLVTFTGTGVTEVMKQAYAYIGIVYTVRLTDDDWNPYTHTIRDFLNTAAWGDYSDDYTVTVENQPKRLEKAGAQFVDEEGNPQARLSYSLLINAAGEDLNPNGDTLTLVDTLETDITATLELNSVKLYHYDPDASDGLGSQLPENEFSMTYDLDTHTMTVTMDDETPYVLLYDYIVDRTAILDGMTHVRNRAQLTGDWVSEVDLTLRTVNSNAQAWQRRVIVYKVDEQNYAKVLPGAQFTAACWDPAAQTWLPLPDDDQNEQIFVSNAEGKIQLTLSGADHDIENGKLYRVTEIQAPVGYENEHKVIYFLCLEADTTDELALFDQAAQGAGVDAEDVYFLSYNGGTCIVTNTFSGLTVTKRWFDVNGVETTEEHSEPVTVTLYQSTDPTGETGLIPVPAEDSVQNPVQLGPDNDWSYTWDRLTAYDEAGQQIYFFVEELPVDGYVTEYDGNGVTGGTIAISNCSEPYKLPETGSSGTRGLMESGALLVGLASVLLGYAFLTQRKKKFIRTEESQ